MYKYTGFNVPRFVNSYISIHCRTYTMINIKILNIRVNILKNMVKNVHKINYKQYL